MECFAVLQRHDTNDPVAQFSHNTPMPDTPVWLGFRESKVTTSYLMNRFVSGHDFNRAEREP